MGCERKVVIAGAVRTAVGTLGGSLAGFAAVDLGAMVIKEALKRAGVPGDQVDMVYMGNVLQAAQGQNPARQASIKAGLPVEVPALTANIVCGSGLQCVNMGAALIKSGDADIVVAGGMESMSNAPYAIPAMRFGKKMDLANNTKGIVDIMVNDGVWDAFNNYHMGITARATIRAFLRLR